MVNWRHVNTALHRDIGYLCAALTVVYAVSGVAVNHMHDWNPNYRLEREVRSFAPIASTEPEEMVTALVKALDLPGRPKAHFRQNPTLIDLFYDGWSLRADTAAGTATVERWHERPLLREANFLHLNQPRNLWTWLADLYAVGLAFLAVSGLFILRGRTGFLGRGKWFVLAGFLIPLAFVLWARFHGGIQQGGESRGKGEKQRKPPASMPDGLR